MISIDQGGWKRRLGRLMPGTPLRAATFNA